MVEEKKDYNWVYSMCKRFEEKGKEIHLDHLRNELSQIRFTMDSDARKAKQTLTNLINNLANKQGKVFK